MFLLKNLDNFIKTRPPLILFTIYLLILTISVFSFAIFISNSGDITNTDVLHDWVELKKHFNKLSMCLTDRLNSDLVVTNYSNVRSIFTKINLTTELDRKSAVKGYITLEEWKSSCMKPTQKPDSLLISFELMSSSKATTETCVKITGPGEYLPEFNESSCQVAEIGNNYTTILTSAPRNKRGSDFCSKGNSLTVTFDTQKEGTFSVFLNKSDRDVIRKHLIWSGSLLLVMVVIILGYAICRPDGSNTNNL